MKAKILSLFMALAITLQPLTLWADTMDTQVYATEAAGDFINTVEGYDSILYDMGDSSVSSQAFREVLYKRTLVDRVGYDYLQSLAGESEDYYNALSWLFNDFEALDMYINGGAPEGGSYTASIRLLAQLYTAYREDMSNPLYKRMIITLSLTHAQNVTYWLDTSKVSDPFERYEIYRRLYENGHLINNVFENLTVEEMRWVMNNISNDEEIEWLNYYERVKMYGDVDTQLNTATLKANSYNYITYTFGYNYYLDKYYAEDNQGTWEDKYHLKNTPEMDNDDSFLINVPYEEGHPKLWVVFEEGAVCGGISKTGANLLTAFGIPSVVVGQPGHAAYLRYGLTDATDATFPVKWEIYNDISGWTKSEKGERLPLGWGSDRTGYSNIWNNGYRVAYVLLAQACLDDYDSLVAAEDYVKLGDIYSDDYERAKDYYERAISIQELNVDAWKGLITLYKNNNATDSELLALAKRVSDTFTYYPLPMYDILKNLIQPGLSAQTAVADLTSYGDASLHRATLATEENVLQPNPCKAMANYILGNYDTSLATFSFDGDRAGEIVLSEEFAGGNNNLLYSLDGGESWTDAGMVGSVALTEEELTLINAENDILVKLQGSSDSYAIDILEGTEVTGVYLNDNENRLIGGTGTLEYSYDGVAWTVLTEESFPGDTTVYVRRGSTGTYLPGAAGEFTFTADTHPDTRAYVSLGRISLADCSSQETSQKGDATNAIDGNINTIWHTLWNGTDTDRYITLEAEAPVYLSGIDYTPRQSGLNGVFTVCEVYTSLDGVSWTKSATANWSANNSKKSLTLQEPVYTKYVKLVATEAYGGFASAAMVELFEDTTYSIDAIEAVVVDKMPYKAEYGLGDELDLSGMELSAHLRDGSTRPLLASEYTVDTSGFSTDKVGDKTITIRINDSDVTGELILKVFATSPTITLQPVSDVYLTGAELQPLTVEATMSDGSRPTYTWYTGADGNINEADEVVGTGAVFTPDGAGYYYAAVSGDNSATVYTQVARIMIGDYEAAIGATGYDTLAEAVERVADGDIIDLMRDVTLTSSIGVGKDLTIKGNGYRIFRGADLTAAPMFDVTAGSLTLDGAILDGGAVWDTGNYNATLGRYMGNSGIIASAPVIRVSGSGELVLTGASVVGNNHNTSAYSNAGGGILAINTAKVYITDGSVTNNSCDSYGGGIMLKNNATLLMDKGSISGNYAPSSGGGICVDHTSKMTVTGGALTNNLSGGNGGAMWLSNGAVTIKGGTILGNGAVRGEGIYVNGSGAVNISAFDTFEDVIYMSGDRSITIGGDLTGKSLSITLKGTVDRVADCVRVTEDNYVQPALEAITFTSYAKAKAGNIIRAVNTAYDLTGDGYVDRADAASLLKLVATSATEDKDILDVVDIMKIYD